MGRVGGFRSLEGWRVDWAGGQLEEPGISGRELGIGGKGINRSVWDPGGGKWSTIMGSAGRGIVRKAPIGEV